MVDPVPRFSIFASDVDIAAPVRGQLRAGARRLLRVRAAARVHALRAADDPDPVRHHRRRGRALDKLRALVLSLAYVLGMALAYAAAGVAAGFLGRAARGGAAERVGARRLCASCSCCSRCRCSASTSCSCPGFLHQRLHSAQQPPARRALASVAAMGAAVGGDRQPLRRGAARRRAALHLPDARRRCSAARRCSRWRSAWACRCIVVGVSEGALLPRAGAWMDGREAASSACCCSPSRSGSISPVLPPPW